MNRREFSVGAACLMGAVALGATPSLVLAQARPPQEGTDFVTLGRAAPVDAPAGKIEVVDFFWYSCPHCNAFAPQMRAWQQRLPADVVVKHVPVAFRDDFVPQQRLYYTLEAMGKAEELHLKVFNAIHDERMDLAREAGILNWAGKQGLDVAKFKEVYTSFAVSSKARRAAQIQDAYRVEGVPALGIAGRYYTDGTMAGNMPRALQVAEFLVAEARKSR